MQIKVFKAGNMKDAMAAMKAELGEDAVILHSKKYKEGGILGLGSKEVVEITAAVEEISMPKKADPPRLKHPTVVPNSLLTRYKTDGTAQGVDEARQRSELTQMDALAEKVAAQKTMSNEELGIGNDSVSDNTPTIDLTAQEESVQPSEETQPAQESPQPVEETQPAQESAKPVEETQPSQESPSPAEETQPAQESPSPAEETQPSQESAKPAEESQPSQESAKPAEETQPAQESPSPAEESQPSQESAKPAEETQPSQESAKPAEETQPSQESAKPAEETQPAPIFTQEQMAQTQAMLMAQFNQMQMMQQAAIAQAQAQAQAQAAEQIRLHQEQAAEQLRLQQEQVAEQLRLQQEQAQQASIAQPVANSQNEEKLRHLEEEIAQMKALLAEILGRDAKKGVISLHEALKRQEVEEEILTEMAAQSTAGETLVDIHTPAAKTTLTNYLNEHIKFSEGIKLNRHGVRIVALLGTTGVGKTTTLAKIAAKFVLEQRTNVALITADTYRISAVEQLKTYSDILELPLEIVYNPAELAAAIERHRDKELILIDTAGRSQHNEYQLRELEEFLRINPRIEKHLVISSTTKFTDAKHIMHKFSQVEPDRIIFTKTDETGSLGMIINLLRDNPASLSYVTTGQSVPDDIERASADVIANLLFKKVDDRD